VLGVAVPVIVVGYVEPGRCAFCGCTDEHSCDASVHALHAAPGLPRLHADHDGTPGLIRGCGWANDDRTCCTVCDAVLKRLAELPEIGYRRMLALTDETRELLRAIRANA